MIHVEIEPIKIWVENRVLFDEDITVEGWTSGKIFAISSYTDHAITCQILLDNGAIFSYIPLHRLRHIVPNNEKIVKLDLEDLVYHNCPSNYIAINKYKILENMPCMAYFIHHNFWINAKYLFSVDWYQDNELCHLLALTNGQLAFLPNHKIIFSKANFFPKYKKLHSTWKI